MKRTIEELKRMVAAYVSDPNYYRNLRKDIARHYHPDKAINEADRANREEIMKQINALCDRRKK